MPRRHYVLPAAISMLAGGAIAAAPAAAAPNPTPITVPGGLRPGLAAAELTDTCKANSKCTIVKDESSDPSCTGYRSQTTPPKTIRVLVTGGTVSARTYAIKTVDFETYVENVLPDEWFASWDGDALKAGAVAVKSYGWFWVNHYGGFLGSTRSAATCFDVTDDQLFQVYRAGSAVARTTSVVQQTWPFAARVGGQVLQTFYRNFLNNDKEACGAYADGTTMSQWGTQNCVEASTANKYNVILGKYYFPGLQLTTARQRRTAHDFTFLQKSTPATFHAGRWSVADGYPTTFSFGASGDVPTVMDTGDGFARVGVYRPSTGAWYLGNDTGRFASKIGYGASTDVPVPAHYSGVSKPSVIAIFRPADGSWHRRGLTGVRYGQHGDIPVPGHYAGSAANDYADTVAVFRPSSGRWYRPGLATVSYGQKGDIPAPADYDGNGTTDLAVYRPSTHTFYVRGRAGVHWGAAGDVPVTGDFNGDGRADLAVYRPSTHTLWIYVQAAVSVGAAGDTPVGKAPYRG